MGAEEEDQEIVDRSLAEELAGRRPTRDETMQLLRLFSKRTVVRRTRLDGTPYAFRGRWTEWETIRDIVVDRLRVARSSVWLTGSANQGFKWLTNSPWDPDTSDLDLFIVDRDQFEILRAAAQAAISARRGGTPKLTARWAEKTVAAVEQRLARGFVYTKHLPQFLPAMRQYTKCRICVSRYAQKRKLCNGKVSFRVYRDTASAEAELIRSLEGQIRGR